MQRKHVYPHIARRDAAANVNSAWLASLGDGPVERNPGWMRGPDEARLLSPPPMTVTVRAPQRPLQSPLAQTLLQQPPLVGSPAPQGQDIGEHAMQSQGASKL